MLVENIDTTNMCSHLRHKLMDADGIYHHVWQTIQDNPELTAVVRSRQLHIYRNGNKVGSSDISSDTAIMKGVKS